MVYGKDMSGYIPAIYPNKSQMKESWFCFYTKEGGRYTVPKSRMEEILKTETLVRIVSSSHPQGYEVEHDYSGDWRFNMHGEVE